jgi:hypothetical protein
MQRCDATRGAPIVRDDETSEGCVYLQYGEGQRRSAFVVEWRAKSAFARGIARGALLTLTEIDRYERYRQTLLGEKNSHPARIGRARILI